MPFTFGADRRVRHHAEFAAVQRHGRRTAGRYLTMLSAPNTLGRDRLGLIASRRLGNAVERNRAKRRVRELFRHLEIEAPAPGRSFDVVIIPRRELVRAPFRAIQADFLTAMSRLRPARRS
jgi:ribonuclease P protein component